MDEEKEKEEVSGLFTCPEDGRIQRSERWKKKHYLTRPVPTVGLHTASERSVDELYSPLEMGGLLKQQGLDLSLQKNKESS